MLTVVFAALMLIADGCRPATKLGRDLVLISGWCAEDARRPVIVAQYPAVQ
jgi:hypothetical protein